MIDTKNIEKLSSACIELGTEYRQFLTDMMKEYAKILKIIEKHLETAKGIQSKHDDENNVMMNEYINDINIRDDDYIRKIILQFRSFILNYRSMLVDSYFNQHHFNLFLSKYDIVTLDDEYANSQDKMDNEFAKSCRDTMEVSKKIREITGNEFNIA